MDERLKSQQELAIRQYQQEAGTLRAEGQRGGITEVQGLGLTGTRPLAKRILVEL